MSPARRKKATQVRRERTPFEIALLAGSVAAIVVITATLALSAFNGPEGPANLRVSAHLTNENRHGGTIVEVTIENAGGETAENVVIEVDLGDETREAEVLSIAKNDREFVTLVFPPGATGSPSARVLSHNEPTRQ